jgi:hypothetical protein
MGVGIKSAKALVYRLSTGRLSRLLAGGSLLR